MVVGDISLITSVAIRLANNVIGTSIPVLSTDEITHLISNISYLKMRAGIGAGKIRNTIDNFQNRPRRFRPEAEPTIKKSEQEQEQKRRLWGEQQKARLKNNLPENRNMAGGQDKSEIESNQEKLDKETTQGPQNRNPRAIAARMRELQKREEAAQIEKKLKGQIQSSAGIGSTSQHLKNVYRVINGTSAVTIIGLTITISIMNAQLIFGNLLKLKRFPKLSLIEIIIIVFLDLIISVFLLLLFILIYIILHPGEIIKQIL